MTIVDGGLLGWRSIGAMATASMPVFPRVLRAAASHTRSLPDCEKHEQVVDYAKVTLAVPDLSTVWETCKHYTFQMFSAISLPQSFEAQSI